MGRIYKGQTSLRLVLNTFADLTGALNAAVRYAKPSGEAGELAAGVPAPEDGLLCHDFAEGELDESGWWRFWAFVTFPDGRSAAGEAARVYVREEGQ